MKPSSFPALLLGLSLAASTVQSVELTPDQIQSLKARLKSLKENLDTHLTTRNTTAAQTFITAAADPRAAVELYLNCTKMVDYDREEIERPDQRRAREAARLRHEPVDGEGRDARQARQFGAWGLGLEIGRAHV